MIKGLERLADKLNMKKYCIKKRDRQKAERTVFEFRKTSDGIRLSRNGILDGIMEEKYFHENFVEVKK